MASAVLCLAVDPFLVIFPQEPVAPHPKTCEKAILADGIQRVLGAARFEVATGPIARRNHFLMEAHKDGADRYQHRRRTARGDSGRAGLGKVRIFAPGVPESGKRKEKTKKIEHIKKLSGA